MPHNGGENGWIRARRKSDQDEGGLSGHYSTGVGGLLAMVFLLFFLYPALVVFTQPLYPLSSTAIVAVAITVWIVAWCVLEMVLGWGLR